ncbi:hypothetical protein F5J12DRAFT_846789 [Pisolithus orientalis]|uniref:uncharacterized protein n=1 Tax=Pisolithus orientalis TaxID=936130 RepID=UPI002225569B|nr:uncharacterized protein F5J12DRAFT_846789 [Pisolithus orientalis]KAI5999806.1 hypothetical protein F5J12DRAFT_846789 [Pisolithus orientalis]
MSRADSPPGLDDILASPAPHSLPENTHMRAPTHADSASPQPIHDSDRSNIRTTVTDMLHDDQHSQLTPREKQLTDMVLRLTDTPIPDTDQLTRQADTIVSLTFHRDLLLHQAEEQRLRWAAERDGWTRMAEALIARQSKHRTTNPDREDDIEHLNTSLESENKTLRQKLTETQSRLQLLEAELTRLRPLLLMQPLQSSIIVPPSSLTATPQRPKHPQRKRRKDQLQSIPEDETALDISDDDTVTATAPPSGGLDTVTTPTPSLPSQSTPTPKSKSRRQDSSTSIFLQQQLTKPSRGLSADARVEHLLLAARKVGKERATALSGMLQQLEEREKEREQEKRREEFIASTAAGVTPKTPKRGSAATASAGGGGGVTANTGTGVAFPGYPLPTEGGYIYVSTPSFRPPTTQMHSTTTAPSATPAGSSKGSGGTAAHPIPVFVPAYPHPIFQTPTSSSTARTRVAGTSAASGTSGPSGASGASSKQQQQQQRDTRIQNPHTPLDSLLSAARSMMQGGDTSAGGGGGRGDGEHDTSTDDQPFQMAGSRRSALVLHDDDMVVPDSPVPKRRKLTSREDMGSLIPASNATTAGASNAATGRVRSALDVLADQAAAFSPQEVGSRTTTTTGTGTYTSNPRKGKGKERETKDKTARVSGFSNSRKKKGKEREKVRGDESESEEHTGSESTSSEKDSGGTRSGKAKSRKRGSETEKPPPTRSRTPESVREETPGPRGGMKDNGSIGDVSAEVSKGASQDGSRAITDGSRTDVPGDPGGGEDATTPKPKPNPSPLVRGEQAEVYSATTSTNRTSPAAPIPRPVPSPIALTSQTLSQTQSHMLSSIPLPSLHTHIPPSSAATPSTSASSRESSPLDMYTRQQLGPHPSVTGLVPPVSVLGGTSSGSLIHTEGGDTSTQSQPATDPSTQPASGARALSQTRDGTPSTQTTTTGTPIQTARNKTVARVANQDTTAATSKRQRSPYMKWSKEEDELLTQAVAKYGQKWDLVQKALPSRGYHQVRQRWLRKLGVFDSKPDLSSFQTGSLTSPLTSSMASWSWRPSEPPPNPKLGLAPLSSELMFSSSSLPTRGGGGGGAAGSRVP